VFDVSGLAGYISWLKSSIRIDNDFFICFENLNNLVWTRPWLRYRTIGVPRLRLLVLTAEQFFYTAQLAAKGIPIFTFHSASICLNLSASILLSDLLGLWATAFDSASGVIRACRSCPEYVASTTERSYWATESASAPGKSPMLSEAILILCTKSVLRTRALFCRRGSREYPQAGSSLSCCRCWCAWASSVYGSCQTPVYRYSGLDASFPSSPIVLYNDQRALTKLRCYRLTSTRIAQRLWAVGTFPPLWRVQSAAVGAHILVRDLEFLLLVRRRPAVPVQ
jgi:hypothetical protein